MIKFIKFPEPGPRPPNPRKWSYSICCYMLQKVPKTTIWAWNKGYPHRTRFSTILAKNAKFHQIFQTQSHSTIQWNTHSITNSNQQIHFQTLMKHTRISQKRPKSTKIDENHQKCQKSSKIVKNRQKSSKIVKNRKMAQKQVVLRVLAKSRFWPHMAPSQNGPKSPKNTVFSPFSIGSPGTPKIGQNPRKSTKMTKFETLTSNSTN